MTDDRQGLTLFREDRKKYGERRFFTTRPLWAVFTFRLGQTIQGLPSPVRRLARPFYAVLYMWTQVVTNIEIPVTVTAGPGLTIHHGGNIVLHPEVKLGRDCMLLHGVTLGNRGSGTGTPVLGDRVAVLAYAQVLGGVRVGDDATIGAFSLLTTDLPSRAIAVGVPAKIVKYKPALGTSGDLLPAEISE